MDSSHSWPWACFSSLQGLPTSKIVICLNMQEDKIGNGMQTLWPPYCHYTLASSHCIPWTLEQPVHPQSLQLSFPHAIWAVSNPTDHDRGGLQDHMNFNEKCKIKLRSSFFGLQSAASSTSIIIGSSSWSKTAATYIIINLQWKEQKLAVVLENGKFSCSGGKLPFPGRALLPSL